MIKLRRTTLFCLQPSVEFSFKPDSKVYVLKEKRQAKRSGRFTLVIRKKGYKAEFLRHFTEEQMNKIFVCIQDDPQKSNQPKHTISLIFNCVD